MKPRPVRTLALFGSRSLSMSIVLVVNRKKNVEPRRERPIKCGK